MFITPLFGGCKYTNKILIINNIAVFQHFNLLITHSDMGPGRCSESRLIMLEDLCELSTAACFVHKNGLFYGYVKLFDVQIHKMARFYGFVLHFDVRIHKIACFYGLIRWI